MPAGLDVKPPYFIGRMVALVRMKEALVSPPLLRKYATLSYAPNMPHTGGVRAEPGTRLFGDQLWRAEAGSWQIADGSDGIVGIADGTCPGHFRRRFSSSLRRRAVRL